MKYPPLVSVTSVEPLEGFVLRLSFDDGTVRELDLDSVIRGPVFEPIRRDPTLFRQVRVDEVCGTIVWPGEVDLDPTVLHARVTGTWDEETSTILS